MRKTRIRLIAVAGALAAVSWGQPAHADRPSTVEHGRESFGVASWYGGSFHGQRTANGEKFNARGLTAAHPTLPFGTLVEVSRTDRKKTVVVCITDRGPFTGRAIDLSRAAARRLHMTYLGTAPVKMQIIGMAE